MRLAILVNIKFTFYENHVYSVNFTEEYWNKRYLNVFDEITVIGRRIDSDSSPVGHMVQSDTDKVSFKCLREVSRFKRLFNVAKEKKFIRDAIADCDVVICMSWWGVSVYKKMRKPYMIEVINCTWDSYWNHSLLGKIVAIPCFLMQRRAIYNAPFVLYVTKFFLQNRYPTKGKNVGVSDVDLKNGISNSVLENRLNRISMLRKDKFIIGTAAGVDVAFKGQKYVIKALSILKSKGIDNVEYQLAGGGDQRFLKKYAQKMMVENQVVFLGPVSHDDIFNWFDNLDCYIQPSFQEGLPRSVVEAMSRGLPCIGSDAGGIPELIDKSLICKRKSKDYSNQIATKIESLITGDMSNIAKQNFEKSKEFLPELLIEQRKNFYMEFLKTAIKQEGLKK